MSDIYYILIYCSALQYSALGHYNSVGWGRVILSMCTVWGPQGVVPIQRPVDASSRNWIWEDWGEYLENIVVE